MMNAANQEINVEDLMRRIREEVARRQKDAPHPQIFPAAVVPAAVEGAVMLPPYPHTPVSLPRAPESAGCVTDKPEYALADFLDYHDEDFVRSAYRGILRREPDASGFAHYLSLLRNGRLSKAELLGRMRYSPEGKACAVTVHGLLLPFALHTAYRIPVLGYGLALANFIVRLPAIVRNWKRFETTTLRQRREQAAQLNSLASQVEGVINGVQRELGERDVQLVQFKSSLISVKSTVDETNSRVDDFAQRNANAAELAATATRLGVAQVETLVTQTEEKILGLTQALETKANNERLTQLTSQMVDLEQRKADARELTAMATSLREALAQKAGVAQLEALTTQTSEKILGLIQAVETKADNEHLSQLTGELAATATRLAEALAQKAGVAQVEALAAQSGEKIVNLTNVLETKADNEHLTQLTNQLFDLAQRKADAATTQQETLEIQRQILDHKRNILDQQRRLALLLEEARKRLPEPISIGQIENMVAEEDHLLDAFYVSFEDRFRGTREDIKQRVAVYLPIVKEAKAGTKKAPILDIGCGRGEWLQLLQENKFVAGGVDLNRVMVSQCQELGLEVAEADGIAYLRRLKANSLGAVTGIHIIEHIPFKRLIALFDEALRVLKPGGVAIFETPNPENLIVGACNFYYDPTHLNPLPPEPMRFVMEARGFGRVEVLRLHPQPESAMLRQGAAQVQRIVNELMFGAQDYALVAYKS